MTIISLLQVAAGVASRPEPKCPSLPACLCYKNMTVIDCSYGGFTHIPDIPETVLDLNLENNNITSIPSRAFSKLSKLQTLNLNHNNIQSIEAFAFDGLECITKLQLRKNQLKALESNSFANIPCLQNLTLAYNVIEQISEDAFDGTTAIRRLVLDGNSFTTVPSVGHQPYLNELHLFTNNIVGATFPNSYRNGSKTLLINLSENKIQALGNETFLALTGVTVTGLTLTNNNISTIAAGTFTPLSTLESLKLGSNPLAISAIKNVALDLEQKSLAFLDLSGVFASEKEFYEGMSFFKNTTITTLELCRNSISYLANGVFKEFKNVRVLHLSKNELFEVSTQVFADLHDLVEVGLDNNMFTVFPRQLPKSLTNLNLAGNRITTIRTNDMKDLQNLNRLSIRKNQIGRLEKGAFNGLERLDTLYLSNNQIGVLSGFVFQPLKSLTHLFLNDNNLHQIFQVLFDPMKSLRRLDLSGNGCCDRMQGTTFASMTSLRYLHLERNNLSGYIASKDADLLFKGLSELKEIHLSTNNIQRISDSLFKDQVALEILKLDNNPITGWGPNLFKHTANMTKLDMSHNKIGVLYANNLADLDNLDELNLANNPFVCGCDLLWFREWIDRTAVSLPGKKSYKCASPKQWGGKPLLEFTKDKINCTFVATEYAIAIIASISTALIISLLSGFFVYRNRWRIRLRLYLLSNRGRQFIRNIQTNAQGANYGSINDDIERNHYDAYVSCSEDDNEWVLKHLLPGIDDGLYEDGTFGGEFKLYHDPRDFNPGKLNTLLLTSACNKTNTL